MHRLASRSSIGLRATTSALSILQISALACAATLAQQPSSSATSAAAKAPILAQNYGKLPLSFEANQGQSDPQVKFLSRGNGYSLFLTNNSAVLALTKRQEAGCPASKSPGFVISTEAKRSGEICGSSDLRHKEQSKTDVVRLELSGANPASRVEGAGQLPGTANYFIGNDPSKWHSNVPTYARVSYKSVYPGVDLVYYGNQRQLEYDFVVAPGADPKSVKLHFAGAEKLRLTPDGDLMVIAKNGEVAFHKPVVYQLKSGLQKSGQLRSGQREFVDGRFVLLAGNSVEFAVGGYDRSRDLVIDPILAYSTYLGGVGSDEARAIAVDAVGSAYVTGYTFSANFPIVDSYQKTNNDTSGGEAFVTKLNPRGTALVYSTYLGGSGTCGGIPELGTDAGDSGNAIAVDSSGDAYIAGQACSNDFPLKDAYQGMNNGGADAFVTKLNAAGSALIFSTYLGGSNDDYAQGIAVDASGEALIAGQTFSGNSFPHTAGAFQTSTTDVSNTAFVTKFNAAGSALEYSTFLGDGYSDAAYAIAVDSSGDAYVTGYTFGNFPVTENAAQPNFGGAANAFVAKINPAGSDLLYSTYLGGSGYGGGCYYGNGGCDEGRGIAVDSAENAYVTGFAYSHNFPTLRAYQPMNFAPNGGYTGFVSKIDTISGALVYSTYLGGSGGESVNAVAVDAAGHAYVTGATSSYASTSTTGFPVTANAYQSTNKASANKTFNAFLTELNIAGDALIYSTYLGGAGNTSGNGDSGNGIALDSLKNPYIAGYAYSSNFPTLKTSFQPNTKATSGNSNAFVARFAFPTATTTNLTSDDNPAKQGTSVTFTADVPGADGSLMLPTGTVTFSVNGGTGTKVALDDTGHAAFLAASLPVGLDTITATYSGDINYVASSATYSETVYTPAVLTSPAPGTTLPGTSATFIWSEASSSRNDGYWLFLGTSGAGSKNLYDSGQQTATSPKVTDLPTNGETIYARLYTDYNGTLVYNDYTYKAAAQAVLTSPAPGGTLPGIAATFTWTAATGSGNAGYWLFLGTTGAGSKNLYDSGQQIATSAKVTDLPTNGETIYARVYTDYNGTLVYNDYTYKAAAEAVLTSPAPGSTLAGASATFTWTAATGSGNQGYWLFVGTTGPGSKNLYDSGQQTATSATVTDLPTNGATIYVRVYTDFNSTLVYNDYTYTAK